MSRFRTTNPASTGEGKRARPAASGSMLAPCRPLLPGAAGVGNPSPVPAARMGLLQLPVEDIVSGVRYPRHLADEVAGLVGGEAAHGVQPLVEGVLSRSAV